MANSQPAFIEKCAEITSSKPANPDDMSQKIGHVCNDRASSNGKSECPRSICCTSAEFCVDAEALLAPLVYAIAGVGSARS
jgi:hypothetical protein